MRRAIAWTLITVLLIAFVASFSELQRIRKRFGEVTRHTFHDHADIRLAVIKAALAQEQNPIVLLGDSVAEMGRLPSQLCGKPIINAGIGGAKLSELGRIAQELDSASLVIVVAGSNDIGSTSFEQDYSRLLDALKGPTVVVPATASEATNARIISAAKVSRKRVLDVGFSEFDGLHPTPNAYREWGAKMIDAITGECANDP